MLAVLHALQPAASGHYIVIRAASSYDLMPGLALRSWSCLRDGTRFGIFWRASTHAPKACRQSGREPEQYKTIKTRCPMRRAGSLNMLGP